MIYVLKTIGVLFAVMGVALTTMPSLIGRLIEICKQGKRIYIAAGIRIVIGGLLIWTSSQASFMWIPLIIGILVVLSGIVIFVLPLAKTHAILEWWEAKPEHVRRAGAVIAAILGVLLIYAA